jgi:hypothetical protein
MTDIINMLKRCCNSVPIYKQVKPIKLKGNTITGRHYIECKICKTRSVYADTPEQAGVFWNK